ncbi:MAG: uroporphyrinogen-III synthase, partial [Betaproteobacteria bacterium]|nr:uroporphyrinogen-III synthase [Betaproteobacteria bacterium]
MKAKKVAILETRLGAELSGLVAKRGAIPVHAPALSELPDLDPHAIATLIRGFSANPPGLFIFQTGVGTRALFAATDALGLTAEFLSFLEKAMVAVRGPKPTGALRERKVRIDRSAQDPFTTSELLASIADVDVQGRAVIVQRFGAGNAEL